MMIGLDTIDTHDAGDGTTRTPLVTTINDEE